MPSIYKDIVTEEHQEMDISVEEFLDECSDKEIEEVIKFLIDGCYIEKIQDIFTTEGEDKRDFATYEFDNMVAKLSDLRLRMSLEDEEIVREILNKY